MEQERAGDFCEIARLEDEVEQLRQRDLEVAHDFAKLSRSGLGVSFGGAGIIGGGANAGAGVGGATLGPAATTLGGGQGEVELDGLQGKILGRTGGTAGGGVTGGPNLRYGAAAPPPALEQVGTESGLARYVRDHPAMQSEELELSDTRSVEGGVLHDDAMLVEDTAESPVATGSAARAVERGSLLRKPARRTFGHHQHSGLEAAEERRQRLVRQNFVGVV